MLTRHTIKMPTAKNLSTGSAAQKGAEPQGEGASTAKQSRRLRSTSSAFHTQAGVKAAARVRQAAIKAKEAAEAQQNVDPVQSMRQDNSSKEKSSSEGLSDLTHAQRTSTQVVEAIDAGQAFSGERGGGAERAQLNANYAEHQTQVLEKNLISEGDLSRDSFARLARQNFDEIKAGSD